VVSDVSDARPFGGSGEKLGLVDAPAVGEGADEVAAEMVAVPVDVCLDEGADVVRIQLVQPPHRVRLGDARLERLLRHANSLRSVGTRFSPDPDGSTSCCPDPSGLARLVPLYLPHGSRRSRRHHRDLLPPRVLCTTALGEHARLPPPCRGGGGRLPLVPPLPALPLAPVGRLGGS